MMIPRLTGGLITFLLLLAGCAHYEPVNESEPVRLAVAPIINESELAQVIAPLSRNIREALAHSRHYILTDEDSADAVIHIRVVSLERQQLARDPEDTGRPLSYRETVRASVTWESELAPPWGEEAVTRVQSEVLLYAQPALVTAESAAMAELSDDLSRRILARLEWPVND